VVALEHLEEQRGVLLKALVDLDDTLYAAKSYMGREGMVFHRF